MSNNPVGDYEARLIAEKRAAELQAQLDDAYAYIDKLEARARPDPVRLERLRHRNRLELERLKIMGRRRTGNTRARPVREVQHHAYQTGSESAGEAQIIVKWVLRALFLAALYLALKP